jgi:hypothetical protein
LCRKCKGCMNFQMEEVIPMKIFVGLKDEKLDSVPDYLIGGMIPAGQVTSILRSTGWAYVGIDPFRKEDMDLSYYGPERRALNQRRRCHICPYFSEGKCTEELCRMRYLQFSKNEKE